MKQWHSFFQPRKPKLKLVESKMSDYVALHKPACFRAIEAYKKALATIRDLTAMLVDRDADITAMKAQMAEDKATIEALTAALDLEFPPEAGGSTGNI